MEIQVIKISEEERVLLSKFIGEDYIGNDIDFNRLMPVVEKIETMDYGFKMCRKVVEVYIDSTKENLGHTKLKSRIESLYKAVTEFIKWYNEKKQANE